MKRTRRRMRTKTGTEDISHARVNETRMTKNMPARDKMNSQRPKPPGNNKARKQTDRPAVETIIREAGTSRRNHPHIAARRRRRHPRPLIIAEQRMSQEANERHEHRSHVRSNHSRPPRNHHRRSLLPRPGAGEQARCSQMRKS